MKGVGECRLRRYCPPLTFQRPNSSPYFSVISSAVFASPSFVSCTADTASRRRGGRTDREQQSREPRRSRSCCVGVGAAAARLGRSRAVAAMVGRGWDWLKVEQKRWRRGGDTHGTTQPLG